MFSGIPHDEACPHTDEKCKSDEDCGKRTAWERTKEGAENVKDKTAEKAKHLGDKLKSGWDKTKEGAESGWEKTKEGAENLKEKLTRPNRDEDTYKSDF